MRSAIRIDNLNFAYGTQKIFSHFSLEIEEGKIVSIVGPNNCGKTTLMKLIGGFLPNKDAIVIGYSYLDNEHIKDSAKQIGVVLSDLDNTPIMIFDEIDTGISGTAAMSVSQKIKKISKSHQIICVTHLAVVAAKADYNYCIKKEVDCNSTKTKVSLLTETEALNEIARISSGEITKIALQHAQALRNLSIGA